VLAAVRRRGRGRGRARRRGGPRRGGRVGGGGRGEEVARGARQLLLAGGRRIAGSYYRVQGLEPLGLHPHAAQRRRLAALRAWLLARQERLLRQTSDFTERWLATFRS
jgi:hypothetical protein